jgi:hypothetical protein
LGAALDPWEQGTPPPRGEGAADAGQGGVEQHRTGAGSEPAPCIVDLAATGGGKEAWRLRMAGGRVLVARRATRRGKFDGAPRTDAHAPASKTALAPGLQGQSPPLSYGAQDLRVEPGQHRPRCHLDAPHLEPRRGDVHQRGGAADARWTVGGRVVKMGSHRDLGREEREDLDLGTGAAAAWEENRYAGARVSGSGFVRWVGELGMGGIWSVGCRSYDGSGVFSGVIRRLSVSIL